MGPYFETDGTQISFYGTHIRKIPMGGPSPYGTRTQNMGPYFYKT